MDIKKKRRIGGIVILTSGIGVLILAVWSNITWYNYTYDLLKMNSNIELYMSLSACRAKLVLSSIEISLSLYMLSGAISLLAGWPWIKDEE
jgi:hypothetical protein